MKTQKQKVLDRIEEVGYIDNFWCIHNYILRLGAIIHDLKSEGYEIEGSFGKGKDRKNFFYHITKKPELKLFK